VYLFLKGPNLGDNGRSLSNVSQTTFTDCKAAHVAGRSPTDTECWKIVDVNTDNTWSYKWDTSKLSPVEAFSLAAGNFTIYAVATPADGTTDGLSQPAEKVYETASINFARKPFVYLSTNKETIEAGYRFLVQIEYTGGLPIGQYWLYTINKGIPSGKSYPTIVPGQSGVDISSQAQSQILSKFGYEASNYPASLAIITTDYYRKREIEFTTDDTTYPAQYSIKVVNLDDITQNDTIFVTILPPSPSVTITSTTTAPTYTTQSAFGQQKEQCITQITQVVTSPTQGTILNRIIDFIKRIFGLK
jgi:hypothetical protein